MKDGECASGLCIRVVGGVIWWIDGMP